MGCTGASLCAQEALPDLLRKRLLLMEEVAAYKRRQGEAVEDRVREAAVVEAATAMALMQGLNPVGVRRLFITQIEAAKDIQRYWLKRWEQSGPPPRDGPNLEEIRAELNRLGKAIVASAARQCVWQRADLESALAVDGLSLARRDEIISAIAGLERYDSRLDQVLDTGVLRVGTTGDYPPFTYRASGEGPFEGLDIDLARDLAGALGVEVVFVQTAWPTLMDDLKAGRFDIAMGGISRTLERQRFGFFSIPYHADGKTAIARCSDKTKFRSLAEIDRPNVRVIVNPGGTNEKFVDAHIQRATKVLHQDNRTIFEALVSGQADLMITDQIEAHWQAAKDPRLCVTMADILNYQEKAYLLPRDMPLKAFVDYWLASRIARGDIAQLLTPPERKP